MSYMHTCTGRRVATSEHQTQNLVIVSSMHYYYTNLVCIKNYTLYSTIIMHHTYEFPLLVYFLIPSST